VSRSRPIDPSHPELEAEAILDSLEDAVPSLAARALHIAEGVFPEAATWDDLERRRFEHQAGDRLAAILRMARSGDAVGAPELAELVEAGAVAAGAGAPLPHLLLALRVSRDLIVQAAVRLAGERRDGGAPALAVVLTKVLPVSDRLTDAVARGYWLAVVAPGGPGGAAGRG
jgi:hypothetical protein